METPRPVRLHWFTTDLRLDDNPALAADDDEAADVAGAFVLDPALLRRHAAATRRIALMRASLRALDGDLVAQGSRLALVEGDAAAVLPRLAAALGARRVTCAEALEPAARRRLDRVRRALARDGVTLTTADAVLVHPAGTVTTAAGEGYRVYGPFARAWEALPTRAAVRAPRTWLASARVPADGARLPDPDATASLPAAGAAAARERLASFLRDDVGGYAVRRDLPAVDGTSRLSWHLRWGTLSAAEAVRRAQRAAARDPARAAGVRAWIRELAWRDFYAHLLVANPRRAAEARRRLPLRWRTDDAGFRRWQEGRTGIPLVDAGMRQLRALGWMHNRLRMITASFLTKHLLIDWRLGEEHFWRELLDGQLSQNGGGWTWVVGAGAEAQPFHRIFSPTRQGERFDREGVYVRRWVPELARVPAARIHEPWLLTRVERRSLCPDYPPPVISLDEGRARALAAWQARR